MSGKPVVDDALYSRQLYVYGHEAQAKLSASNVLIVGLGGLGVEIAKNVVLAGVRSVGLLDQTPARESDRGTQFYVTDEHVADGVSLAAASLSQLSSLNPYVNVHTVENAAVTAAVVASYSVVVLVDQLSRTEQLRVAALTRAAGAKLICASAAGVSFGVFVDVGPHHVVSDPDGNQPFRALLSHVTNAHPAVVTVSDEHRHGLSDGMFVTFEEVDGMPELNALPPTRVKVISPYSFSIDVDASAFGAFTGMGGYFNQAKLPLTVAHEPLEAALAAPVYANDDFTGAPQELHALYSALGQFADAAAGVLPAPNSVDDALRVAAVAYALLRPAAAGATPGAAMSDSSADAGADAALKARLLALARCAGAQIAPVTSVAGGVVGQEVVKACTGKFLPIQQWLYWADAAVLPPLPGAVASTGDGSNSGPATADAATVPSRVTADGFSVPAAGATAWSDFAPRGDRYDGYRAVFGGALHRRAMAQRLFLVGAGAIGCEMLKNWALMGAGAGAEGGHITVTDMDSIEKSNLNRQFLFRTTDVGDLKSAAAARAAVAMNPALSITAQALKVGKETQAIYTDDFWRSLSGVYTALDNVEARLYVDDRCVYHRRPLVDSGTLGTKGNTQVIVPFKTESYGSTRDPPEEGIPICTLKNFPHKIEHTIQWARDVFEGDFAQAPADVNGYLTQPKYVDGLLAQPNTALPTLQRVVESLVSRRPLTFEDCILWARWRFESEFTHAIAQLLASHPADAKTAEGTPFWSGTKRAPQPLVFDAADPAHMDFVVAAANLRAFNFKLHGHADRAHFVKVLGGFVPTAFVARGGVRVATTDAEAKELAAKAISGADFDKQVRDTAAQLPSPGSLAGFRLEPVEFEKDDDSNYHIAFITACSNLRARNYRIKEASAHETKFVAGKIIPAIATTTALVTGLVCLEMYKLLQDKPLDAYRSTFCNLADNVLVASEPFPMATQTTTFPNGEEWTWSLWDVVEACVDGGRDITLQELVDWLKKRFDVNVSMLNLGEAMVYLDFGMGLKQSVKERLPLPLSKLAEQVTKTPLPESVKFITFEASITDEDDNELDIPSVRVQIKP